MEACSKKPLTTHGQTDSTVFQRGWRTAKLLVQKSGDRLEITAPLHGSTVEHYDSPLKTSLKDEEVYWSGIRTIPCCVSLVIFVVAAATGVVGECAWSGIN